MSTELQMVIIFGFFILLLIAVGFYMLFFSKSQELKLLYAVLNIVSLILLLIYVFFSYKQSSSIICGIVDSILSNVRTPLFIYKQIVILVYCVFLTLYTSPMTKFVLIFFSALNDILMEIFFGFLFLVEKVYSLVHKFIHWLRNLFNLSKDK